MQTENRYTFAHIHHMYVQCMYVCTYVCNYMYMVIYIPIQHTYKYFLTFNNKIQQIPGIVKLCQNSGYIHFQAYRYFSNPFK